ncbi:MAG: NAD-dependent epimerase/dehydratase family protein, partial [Blautia sp.]|nr:NAD-dependent epimerase/dehydratase family protein [Blautia sp.]
MSIYKNALWLSDLDEVIANSSFLSLLEGTRVMVTGASGLVCSAVVDLLVRYNETHRKKIHILAAGRSLQRMKERFTEAWDREYFTYVAYDAADPSGCPHIACDYIIHGAGNSSPGMIMKEPVETMVSNFSGMKALLDLARESGTKRLLYISTSEVYGKKETIGPFKEGDYGFIEQLDPRSSYSIGKKAAETLCVSYASEYQVDSVIVRPGHIYGPTAAKRDDHVAAVWAYACARGEDLVMKSSGEQLRSYCYCLDCASAILIVLLKGETGHAYNISNPASVVTIREMAELLAEGAGVSVRRELPSGAEKKGFNPMMNSSLDSSALLSLG